MAGDKSIRVVVKVNPAQHPELHEALSELESGRAERIRALALMALMGVSVTAESGHPEPSGGKKRREKPKDAHKALSPTPDTTKAVNDEKSAADKTEAKQPEPEVDPHKDVRRDVLAGLKNVGF